MGCTTGKGRMWSKKLMNVIFSDDQGDRHSALGELSFAEELNRYA